MKKSPQFEKALSIQRDEKKYAFPLNYAFMGAWLMAQFKAHNIKVYNTPEDNSLAEYFVVCTVDNPIQGQAIVREIESAIKVSEQKVHSKEGERSGDWILIDTGDVIFHLFLASSRDVYALDELWGHFKTVEIPQEFYFSATMNTEIASDKTGKSDYF
jgi:ribosome-associated protein